MKSFFKSALLAVLIGGQSLTSLWAADTLKIGVTAGPHVEILNFLKTEAGKEGLTLEIVEFNDFILPNIALSEGALDANIYQHEPFLNSQIESRGFKFINFGKTILLPMGVYSSKYKSLDELPRTGKVAIPNDPSNGGRALLVLHSLELLTLKDGVGSDATVIDIIKNPNHMKIVEVEAPQLPRSLEDVDIAVINTDWILVAGLDPTTALAQEKTDSPYTNIIVIREEDRKKESLKKLKKLYQSDATKKFIKEKFNGTVLAGW